MSASETAPVTKALSLDDPSLYLNRELSLLTFQERVLEEAEDPRHALLERAKFLSILFSNLDEFFMVRVAGLMQIMESGKPETSMDGRTVTAQLEAIRAEVNKILDRAYDYYERELKPALDQAHVHIVDYSELNVEQCEQMQAYFLKSTM